MHKNKKGDSEFGNAIAIRVVHVDPPMPPPPNFSSPFTTLQEWLLHICNTNQSDRPISEYQFLLFESGVRYILSLVGSNTYEIDEDVTVHRIEFKPSDPFFALPNAEYGNLSQQEVRQRLLEELKEFTKTAKFQNSFLAKCESITNNFADVIWSK